MSDIANHLERAQVDRSIEFRLAASVENLAVLRTLVGAVGTFEDLDIDAVADLRLAIDEACTWLIKFAVPGSALVVVVRPLEHEMVVDTSTICDNVETMEPGSISWHVLSSLTDEVRTFQDGEGPGKAQVFGISMTTRRVSAVK